MSKDLFQHRDKLPAEVIEVLDRFSNDDETYATCAALLAELEPLGYTFDYYLDAIPFDLKRIRTTAAEIYERAEENGIYLEATCVGVGMSRWEKLMAGATRADKRRVEAIMIKHGHLTRFDANMYNPYDYYKTETHLIYVHSSIEHFFRIND